MDSSLHGAQDLGALRDLVLELRTELQVKGVELEASEQRNRDLLCEVSMLEVGRPAFACKRACAAVEAPPGCSRNFPQAHLEGWQAHSQQWLGRMDPQKAGAGRQVASEGETLPRKEGRESGHELRASPSRQNIVGIECLQRELAETRRRAEQAKEELAAAAASEASWTRQLAEVTLQLEKMTEKHQQAYAEQVEPFTASAASVWEGLSRAFLKHPCRSQQSLARENERLREEAVRAATSRDRVEQELLALSKVMPTISTEDMAHILTPRA